MSLFLNDGYTATVITDASDGYAALLFNREIASTHPQNYNFDSTLFNMVNDMIGQLPAHFAEGPSIHLMPDEDSGLYLSGLSPTIDNYNDAVNALLRIRLAMLLHASDMDVHTSADTVNFNSIPDMPDYSDVAAVVDLGNALKAAWNAHMATTGSVHGATDLPHIITATDATLTAFYQAVANATLKVMATAVNIAEHHVWEMKFGFYMGTSGDLQFVNISDPFELMIEKASFAAGSWTCVPSVNLKNLVVTVTGDGNEITWIGDLTYDFNVFN